MAKTKNKTGSETEHLRGLLREYEKEIRSLRKQIRQLEKYELRSQENEKSNDNEDTVREFKMMTDCVSCGKGKVVETLQIMGKCYGECSHCGFRGLIK